MMMFKGVRAETLGHVTVSVTAESQKIITYFGQKYTILGSGKVLSSAILNRF